MIVYRIFKTSTRSEYDSYAEEWTDIDEDETIKYVDSKEKVDAFFKEKEEYNSRCNQCVGCPIISLTKRRYNNKKSEVDDYCDHQDLQFVRNSVLCLNERFPDITEYGYEEITVE